MFGVLDIIERLPFELQARLEADPFFADIPVLVAEDWKVKAAIARKQALFTEKGGKRGAAVIILPMIGEDIYPNLAFGPLTLQPAFQVIEHGELNNDPKGTRKSARRIARRIVCVVKPLSLGGLVTEFVAGKPLIDSVDLEAELGALVSALQVNFQTIEADAEELCQVAAPQFSTYPAETPKVQITCATEGATIWYSLNEEYPAPGRDGAIAYTAPIDVPVSGLTIRACAFKAGMIDSAVPRGTISVDGN